MNKIRLSTQRHCTCIIKSIFNLIVNSDQRNSLDYISALLNPQMLQILLCELETAHKSNDIKKRKMENFCFLESSFIQNFQLAKSERQRGDF